jgi:Tfp pilus assembly ATPase PilU
MGFDTVAQFEECLQILVDKEVSDLYYSVGALPSAKFYGTLNQISGRLAPTPTPGKMPLPILCLRHRTLF